MEIDSFSKGLPRVLGADGPLVLLGQPLDEWSKSDYIGLTFLNLSQNNVLVYQIGFRYGQNDVAAVDIYDVVPAGATVRAFDGELYTKWLDNMSGGQHHGFVQVADTGRPIELMFRAYAGRELTLQWPVSIAANPKQPTQHLFRDAR